jgi:hypothetical protein
MKKRDSKVNIAVGEARAIGMMENDVERPAN